MSGRTTSSPNGSSGTGRADLDQLAAAVEAVRVAFAEVATETLTLESLKTASTLAGRLTGMIDGFRSDLARKGRDLAEPPPSLNSRNGSGSRPGRGRGVDDALNPDGRRPDSRNDKDEARAELFDDAPELANATRNGELPGDYADVVNQQLAQVSTPERQGFLQRYRNRLADDARANTLHAFRIHIRGLIADFCADTATDRLNRQRSRRDGKIWDDVESGMTKLFATFDPETGARIRNAVNEEIDRLYRVARDDPNDHRSPGQITADAIANLILGARNTGRGNTELLVLVDLQTLLTDIHHHTGSDSATSAEPATTTNGHSTATGAPADAHASGTGTTGGDAPPGTPHRPTRHTAHSGRCCETADGTPLPVDTVRRLACNANIIPAVLNSDGVILNLGRAQRLATKTQRLALQAMYPHCAIDGCTTPFQRCEIHHINPWSPPTNGTTDLDNLVPVCNRHHHHIHDHHWNLTLTLDPHTRTLTITHSNGTIDTHPIPTRRRQPQPPDTDDGHDGHDDRDRELRRIA